MTGNDLRTLLFTPRDMLRRVSASDGLRKVVRELMKDKGWTQNELAVQLKRTQGSVSQLLSGSRRGGALDLLESIAALMDVSVSELVRRAELNDLSRHSAATDSALPLGGVVDQTAATRDRIRDLEGELAFYKTVVKRARAATTRALTLLGDEGREGPAPKSPRRRSA